MIKTSKLFPKQLFDDNCNFVCDSNSDHWEEEEDENVFEQEVEGKLEVIHKTAIISRVVRVMKNMQGSSNEDASKIMKQA